MLNNQLPKDKRSSKKRSSKLCLYLSTATNHMINLTNQVDCCTLNS